MTVVEAVKKKVTKTPTVFLKTTLTSTIYHHEHDTSTSHLLFIFCCLRECAFQSRLGSRLTVIFYQILLSLVIFWKIQWERQPSIKCAGLVDVVHFAWPHPFISKETPLLTIFKQDGLMQSNSHNSDLLTFAGRKVFPSRVNYLALNRIGKIIEFLHWLEMIKTGKNNETYS